MKIQLASDLHLEFLMRTHPEVLLVDRDVQADVLVLAGDIHTGFMAPRAFADWNKPIVMIAGNHEGYGYDWSEVRRDIKAACAGTPIHFLDNSAVVIDGVRFLGTTLWTDFKIDAMTQEDAMRRLDNSLNDYHVIRLGGSRFSAQKALLEHERCVAWLDAALREKFDGPTVVVTHHGPHPKSIHPRWLSSGINGGFVSDLTPLLAKSNLWLHGHGHDSFDYEVEGCRVVANPHGYVGNRLTARTPADFERENPAYKADLVLEV